MAGENDGKELVFDQSGKPAKRSTQVLNQLDELKALVEKIYDLSDGLMAVDCGMQVRIGNSSAARILATLLGLDEQQSSHGFEHVSAMTEAEEEAEDEPDSAEVSRLPFCQDLLDLPRIRLAALRDTDRLEFLNEFDGAKYIRLRIDQYNSDPYSEIMPRIALYDEAITELIIRIFLGNPDELFELVDFIQIFEILFKDKDIPGKVIGTDRHGLTRRFRKLLASGLIRESVKSHGSYGALYSLNPDYDVSNPYLVRHFFGRINAALHKPKPRKRKKKKNKGPVQPRYKH